MNLKSRSKVSAEFSMSSMTDIVFLLLIFFMLTSTLVTTNAHDIILPKSKAQTVKKEDITVTITKEGAYSLDGNAIDRSSIEAAMLQVAQGMQEPVVILRADEKVSHGDVVEILDIAYRNRLKMVVATSPK
ncbi:MAG: biopolymer transporter ExbD [Schleiferiaceae bacterium]|nr:biopolymer transporter ExbD [Schleiferiaceae bacterium]